MASYSVRVSVMVSSSHLFVEPALYGDGRRVRVGGWVRLGEAG